MGHTMINAERKASIDILLIGLMGHRQSTIGDHSTNNFQIVMLSCQPNFL